MWLKLWFNSIYFFDMNVGAGQAIRQGAIIDMIANTLYYSTEDRKCFDGSQKQCFF